LVVKKNGYLGVSLGTPYYSRKRLQRYLEWSREEFDRFAFLIGDGIYALTYSVLHYASRTDAAEKADALGDQAEASIRRVGRTCGIDPTIVRWEDIASTPECVKLLGLIESAYRKDPTFALAVRAEVWRNLGDRLSVVGVCRSPGCNHEECQTLDRYVVNEVAGLITISEHMGYEVEVYPGNDLNVLKGVYADQYPHLSGALPEQRKREFVTIQL
jgi:tRNA-dependent cyclodipeptide synthase